MKSSTVKKENANKVSSGAPPISTEEILYAPIDDILSKLNTSQSGLASDEVERRLGIYGRNELAKRKKRATIVQFFSYFRNPLILILIIAGTISFFYGETINAIIVFSMVILSVSLTFIRNPELRKPPRC